MPQGGYMLVKKMDGTEQKGCCSDAGFEGLLNLLAFEHELLYDVSLERGTRSGDIKVGFAQAMVRLDHFLADAVQDFRKAVPLRIEIYSAEKNKQGSKQKSMVLVYENAYLCEVCPCLPDIQDPANAPRSLCLKLRWVFDRATFGTERLEMTGYQTQNKKADTLIVENPTA